MDKNMVALNALLGACEDYTRINSGNIVEFRFHDQLEELTIHAAVTCDGYRVLSVFNNGVEVK